MPPAHASANRCGISCRARWCATPQTHGDWRRSASPRAGCRGGARTTNCSGGLLGWSTLWLALAAGFALWLGPVGVAYFIAQGFFAACALEIINYIEHYGLERRRLPDGRHERTTHLHSWNSDYLLSNLLLFQLQRHSDHHALPRRRYQVLRHHADSPQLPGGYASMFLLALCPPLWFRIIDPRVEAFHRNAAPLYVS